ncbi:phenylalanine--tRNA ligase subunit alpha [Candidatus Woesebacteria bacterium CG_4_10_14_0_2_um_filter_39_14]|uniref:Phenylalanine--tRNA ligase alpha subunit n=3 Tax=Microgenomates group TaxID=1794810 RepID=A0A2M6YPH8_9BACT|nr:MAG: phenylalanine--tRNA ligase subunit alpha [Candidatus Shapirobacteria bacterium CG07_land_8_20_14_0_80_39_12]PIZ49399.1 MAG: phenylalanine--tRNA ligase subunit alpha [Candidatus Woesebacteria bacterium CG_4_10_14_0_2_um_filter_39_14]PJA49858.1 MAG: phenylalanine--tRNA ligase subunit alpha [Candidatus Shapirobacteria bacterium CG_4_9_14_3_um_filter_39_13]
MDTNRLQNLKNQAISNILETKNEQELEELRIEYLGRHGQITRLLKEIPSLSPEQKKDKGNLINETKKIIEETIISQKNNFHQKNNREEWFDITIPGEKPAKGHLHLITAAIEEITDIFKKIGFYRVAYPEVEWDWYAFEGLNMPKNHPARDEWETFFIENLNHPKYGEAVLTTHTSSGQLREMQRLGKPPIRMLDIAKCYRRQIDASHAPMFYQFEGLVVDQGINITHLKGTLDFFVKQYFGPQREVRIRPFHFQFTEPSFEVDVSCIVCGGRGCKVCKQGWMELGGAGMVHPTVLKNGGFDPNKYTGFAFGWGVERVLMMKYKIDDIRLLFNGDLRFLEQF